jgi:hypothetical protein
MKKVIALSIVAASVMATSAFAQGYFNFTTFKSQTYDGFTTAGVSTVASTCDVTFLWAASGSTVSGLPLASTPTSGNSTTTESYTAAQAWAAILATESAGWTPAVNVATGNPAVQLTANNGSATYNGGATFGVTGTSGQNQSLSTGATYALYLVAWNPAGGNNTLASAAAAGAAVGWSTVFSYTSGLNPSSSVGSFQSLSPNFGVFTPNVVVTPEPGTLALAALGGAAMLFIRRKK